LRAQRESTVLLFFFSPSYLGFSIDQQKTDEKALQREKGKQVKSSVFLMPVAGQPPKHCPTDLRIFATDFN
jgi:hypothetical protein